ACLQRARDVASHRGPDGEGLVFLSLNMMTEPLPDLARSERPDEYTVGLAHRRLAILDLTDAGLQPMSIADDGLWITYNGEIYNYIELREMLTREGCVFRTHTDTEVILHAYERWGRRCVDRFNGMWAFAI